MQKNNNLKYIYIIKLGMCQIPRMGQHSAGGISKELKSELGPTCPAILCTHGANTPLLCGSLSLTWYYYI